MQANILTRRQLITVILLLVIALPLTATLYFTRNNPYADTTKKTLLTNPLVLKNWLAPSVYDYTMARLQDYIKAHNLNVQYAVAQDNIQDDAGSFGFTINFFPGSDTHYLTATVSNFGSALSTAITIDGTQQNVAVPSATNDTSQGPNDSGIDSLVNNGLSSYQAKALQAAFEKFKPNTSNISIDTSTISATTSQSADINAPSSMTFDVTLDGKRYNADVKYSDLTVINLSLTPVNSSASVFESGNIDGVSL